MSFYYDQIMQNADTTMSVYSYSNSDSTVMKTEDRKKFSTQFTTRAESGSGDDSSGNGFLTGTSELLRLPLNQDITMNTAFQWGSGSALTSTSVTNIAMNLRTLGQNVKNIASAVSNFIRDAKSSTQDEDSSFTKKTLQTAMYNVNDSTKLFGGISQSIPLSMTGQILGYMSGPGTYNSSIELLKVFLKGIYPDWDSKNLLGDDDSATLLNETSSNDSILGNIWKTIAGNGETAYLQNRVLLIYPPHNYQGPSSTFNQDTWQSGTLALRFGNRYIFNLLISSIQVSMSKETVCYDNKISPATIQVALSFEPASIITPKVMMDYLIPGIEVGEDYDKETKDGYLEDITSVNSETATDSNGNTMTTASGG